MKISSYVAVIFCLGLSLKSFGQSVNIAPEKMSVEQKVGQLMIWSFSGSEYNSDLQQTLTKYQPGALIVFRRNIKSPLKISKLLAEAQQKTLSLKAPALFIMVDQEGGMVTRLRTRTPMPSALALAKMADPEFVQSYGHASGEVLQLLGFNVDLAPVLDISNPKQDSFIGNRTFGNDPQTVASLTSAYARGLSSSGMLPTAKHFPGHGGTIQDSHRTTPRKYSSLEELKSHDLVPFQAFAENTFPKAIMMAHLALPNVDSSGLPATYSRVIIRDHLRRDLSYDGLILTDDLEMNGASISKSIGERAVRAFLSGNDMLMVGGPPSHQRQAFAAVLAAVRSGRISKARLNESVQRVLRAKASLPTPPKLEPRKILAAIRKLNEMSKQIMRHNFKVAAERAGPELPEPSPDNTVLVFSASYRFYKNFETSFKGKSKAFILTRESLSRAKSALESTNADFAVFFASGDRTARWLNDLDPDLKEKLIVINCNHEGEVANQTSFLNVLNINSYFPEAASWTAELLNGTPEVRQPAGDDSN